MKGLCPACARRIAPERIVMRRRLGSHPADPIHAPGVEACCAHCLTLAGFESEEETTGGVLCESVEVLRAIERFRRARDEERVEAELELWRESRALEVPEVFELVSRVFIGTLELVADAILVVQLDRERGPIEIAKSSRTRVHETTDPVMVAISNRDTRFILPVGLDLASTGHRSTRVLLTRPRLPFPPEEASRQKGLPATLLAPPSLLRPAPR